MLKTVKWKENAVFSLKLKDDLYSLCQMRQSSLMEFFARSSPEDRWDGIDLNEEKILGQYFVAENRLKPLFVREVGEVEARPNRRTPTRCMLSAIIGANQYGASLVRLNDGYSMLDKEIVRPSLDKDTDWETIRTYELMGMQGSPEKLRTRLLRYFNSGVWWDEQKSFLFSGIRLPEPEAGRLRQERTP